MKKPKTWTEQDDILLLHYKQEELAWGIIGSRLLCTAAAAERRWQKIKPHYEREARKTAQNGCALWEPEHDAKLLELVTQSDLSWKQRAEILGRTVGACEVRYHTLKSRLTSKPPHRASANLSAEGPPIDPNPCDEICVPDDDPLLAQLWRIHPEGDPVGDFRP